MQRRVKGSTIIMQLPTEMFHFQLPSPITVAYAARHSHTHCVFLVILVGTVEKKGCALGSTLPSSIRLVNNVYAISSCEPSFPSSKTPIMSFRVDPVVTGADY